MDRKQLNVMKYWIPYSILRCCCLLPSGFFFPCVPALFFPSSTKTMQNEGNENKVKDQENTAPSGKILIQKHWVNNRMRIELKDGRLFEGKFVCVDHEANIVLDDASETQHGFVKPVGLVMLPGLHIKKCFVEDTGNLRTEMEKSFAK